MNDLTNQILFDELAQDEISFIYLGNFNNVVLGMATELIKSVQENDSEGQKNKLSFLIIESFQNILRYGLGGRGGDYQSGEIFIVRKIGTTFYITTGNFVENDKIEPMREKLERVNSLSYDDLKKLYVQILTNKQLSKQGGAGLGFVEMVRKTKEKLDFDFVKLNEERSYFYFQLHINMGNENQNKVELDISHAKKIKQIMEQNGRFICMQGNFNSSAVNPVLQLAETNINDQNPDLQIQRKVFHILVEMLQNIAKHAEENNQRHEGLFTLGCENGSYTVSASNSVNTQQADKLEKYLDKLTAKNIEELNSYYKEILRNGHSDKSIFSGLGLIDIVRSSSEKIKYNFIDKENGKLFSLTAVVNN